VTEVHFLLSYGVIHQSFLKPQ
jgi:hypothetical protein